LGSSFGAGGFDVYLVKTDRDGNMLWNRTFGGTNHDYGFSVQQTSDGGYIIAGDTLSYGAGDFDAYLVKTDSEGNMLWYTTFGGSNQDNCRSGQQTSDGGYVIAGETKSFGAGDFDMYLTKLVIESEPEPEPEPSPSPESEQEPEQKGIPGFPYLSIVLGLAIALLLYDRFHL